MSDEQPHGREPGGSETPARRVRIPGFTAGTEVGLGEVIKRATTVIGMRPCRSCSERAARLDRWMTFTGRQ